MNEDKVELELDIDVDCNDGSWEARELVLPYFNQVDDFIHALECVGAEYQSDTDTTATALIVQAQHLEAAARDLRTLAKVAMREHIHVLAPEREGAFLIIEGSSDMFESLDFEMTLTEGLNNPETDLSISLDDTANVAPVK